MGVGLIDDIIVASCREISQNIYAEESERIRKQKYMYVLQYTIFIVLLLHREQLLNEVASGIMTGLIHLTIWNEIGIIARNTLESAIVCDLYILYISTYLCREEHLLAEIHRNAMHHVTMQMADYVVAVEIQHVVEESVREAIVQRKEHLNFISSQVIRMRTATYFA